MSKRSKHSQKIRTVVKEPKSDWKHDIKVSQDYVCPVCGNKGTDRTMSIHHCKNKCRGGNNTKENCCAVHIQCHRWIHENYGNKYYDPRNTVQDS